MKFRNVNEVIEEIKSGSIYNHDENDIRNAIQVCALQVSGNSALAIQGSLVAQTLLNHLQNKRTEQLISEIGRLNHQLHDLSKNAQAQLEVSQGMVAEAKATTKLTEIIAALTILLTVMTYYLDIPIWQEMGAKAFILPVILGLLAAFAFWRIRQKERQKINK